MALPVTEYKPGDLVEGYRVMEMMGTGAASIIYLVQDPKTKEIWALKHVEKHENKDTRFLDQAIAEAGIAEKLDHPNIRKIVRCIKRKRALLSLAAVFLVMEFVDGISMERQPPRHDLELALDLFHQTAEALAHMHSRGYIHADMKPNNIIICENRVVKIIDLGQSCAGGTIKPRIQGTPDYIAPEQVHRRPITPKTDIYNLGATMYWVLTGEYIPTALAKGDSLVSRLDDSLVRKAKPANQVNPAIPQRLSDLIMRCVEVDPDKRPENMEWVADQLNLMHGMLRARAAPKGNAAGTPDQSPVGR